MVIGDEQGSNGGMLFNGANTRLLYNGELQVGNEGSGVFTINNAAVFGTSIITVAAEATGFGTLNIDGIGTQLEAVNDFTVADSGQGTLNLTNQATLRCDLQATLAGQAGAVAQVNASSGSSWAVGPNGLSVGSQGSGTINLQSGAEINDEGDLTLGEMSSGQGKITVDGAGTQLSAMSMALGGTAAATGGAGQAFLTNGGLIKVVSGVVVWGLGTLDVSGGGTVDLGSSAPVTSTTDQIYVSTSGNLSGTGTVKGNLLNASGTVFPGEGANGYGTLALTGNYVQNSGGTLQINLAGAISSGLLAITGPASLSGTLSLQFPGGYNPPAGGATFTVLTASGGITGNFTSVVSAQTGITVSESVSADQKSVTVKVSGSGSPPVAFSQWAAAHAVSTNPTATPENDGVPNLLKYLYDINPSQPMTAADRAALPVLEPPP